MTSVGHSILRPSKRGNPFLQKYVNKALAKYGDRIYNQDHQNQLLLTDSKNQEAPEIHKRPRSGLKMVYREVRVVEETRETEPQEYSDTTPKTRAKTSKLVKPADSGRNLNKATSNQISNILSLRAVKDLYLGDSLKEKMNCIILKSIINPSLGSSTSRKDNYKKGIFDKNLNSKLSS